MFSKSLESITAGLDKILTDLDVFAARNAVVVDELQIALAVATEDQTRAERITSKLRNLLS